MRFLYARGVDLRPDSSPPTLSKEIITQRGCDRNCPRQRAVSEEDTCRKKRRTG